MPVPNPPGRVAESVGLGFPEARRVLKPVFPVLELVPPARLPNIGLLAGCC